MLCPICGNSAHKFGHANGRQRFHCLECARTFREPRPRPLDEMRIPDGKAALTLRMLLEGNSIRSVERLLEINRNTIMKLLLKIGERCHAYFVANVRGVYPENVQCDEVWAFVGCKEKTRSRKGYSADFGDCYCFTAIERDTKLMIAYAIGRRDVATVQEFAHRLKGATVGRNWQLSTDGFQSYRTMMPGILGHALPFAQVIKIFTGPIEGGPARYSPPEIRDLHIVPICGNPDVDKACTSHVERSNLTVRMTLRRFTRLTNAFSKSPRHHDAALGLFFLYYNFCRVHSTIKQTPAMASGLADHVWSMNELIEKVATY